MKRLLFATSIVFFGLFAALYSTQAKSTTPTQEISNAQVDLSAKIRLLSSSNPVERATAACQLGAMGKRASEAIPHLIQMLADDTQISGILYCDEDGKGRRHFRGGDEPTTPGHIAASALAEIGAQSVDPLLGVVRHLNPVVRMNAIFGLGIINDPRTIEPLIGGARDADLRVRENAVWGMGLKHDQSVVEPLIAALNDGESRVRAKAAWSLGLQGDGRAIEPLTNALRDQTPGVREQAAWSLGLKGSSQAVEPLMNALNDSEARVRQQAAWSLGLKGDRRAVEALMNALKDIDASVRSQAAWALGLKGDHRAVEALNAAMKDSSSGVRKNAAWALGMILMRDGKAAEKAADLDIDVKKIREKPDDKDLEEQTNSPEITDGLDIPIPVPVPIPLVVPISIPVSVEVPTLSGLDVSPRIDLAPGKDVPGKIKERRKDKN